MHIPLQGIVALDPDGADGVFDHRSIAAGIGNRHGHRGLGLATGQNWIGTIWTRSGWTACTSSCTKPHSLSR
jgi:hypothetical protein